MKNPNWTRDELILALNFYFSHRDIIPSQDHPDIIQLSNQLTALNKKLSDKSSTFRNPNGVYMKLNNFRSIDPDYTSTGKVGLWRHSKGDLAVWNDFSMNPKQLSQVAATILENCENQSDVDTDIINDNAFAMEGRLLSKIHYSRERSQKLKALKKKQTLKTIGILKCEACGFVFSEKYGKRGEDVIEVHHNKPLHTLSKNQKTTLEDLTLLCANCHRIIHAKKPWLTVDELKQLIRDTK